jgi:hypothetical protein
VSTARKVVVALALVVLCAAIVFAITASMDFLLVGLVVVVAVAATYLTGRLDRQNSDSTERDS